MAVSVGVVVPNYNCGPYLQARIASIAAQDLVPEALVFLDDASTDGSWDVATPLLETLPMSVSVHRNASNGGSVLRQWREGVSRLGTDLIWIAEADDRAEPGLLRRLADRLESDAEAVFAFCDSVPVDAEDRRLADDSKQYYRAAGTPLLAEDARMASGEFLRTCLCPRNLVLNASAVLWRASKLRAALDALQGEARHWLCAGDWRVYVEACAGTGTVHFVADALNAHRRHGGSVTGSANAVRRYGEVVLLHAKLRERLGHECDDAMRGYLTDLRRAWSLGPPSALDV